MNRHMALSTNDRRHLISVLIASGDVRSQSQLVQLLSDRGVKVTQATASRDLEDLGAYRIKNSSGELIYVIAPTSESSATSPSDLIIKMEVNGNLVVARTPPGGAQLLASAIDQAESAGHLPSVMGTIAGDDTVLIIARTHNGGEEVCSQVKSAVRSRF